MKRKWLLVTGLILGSLAVSGCAARPAYFVPGPPPPPPRALGYVGYPPAPGYVWTDGFWAWRGSRWAWVPGQWVRPPRPHAVWVPGYWQARHRGYAWRTGHWR